ncbi:hypothetical protein DRW03_07335 [Corallococcus sp. H22C18031201]|nr:hypothetical protein DRW03_07335 [Corallococcus sp. H22C18031201]
MQLEGRKVIVVGAGSGIGKGVALAASRAGAHVVLAGRARATLEATSEAMTGSREVRVLDASVEAEVAAFPFLTGAVLSVDGCGVLM